MNKKNIFISCLTLLMLFFSCEKDDFGGENIIQPVSFTVNLSYDENLGDVNPSEVSVTLKDTNSDNQYTQITNEQGVAFFEEVIPGTYTASATISYNSTDFENKFGFSANQDETNFNAVQEGVVVNENVTTTDIKLKSAKIGDLLIKQIYYAGSDTANGAIFRDQFIEIFNNSNEIIYADGLCVAQLFGNTSTTVRDYTLNNGQYDWSKSINITPTGNSANTDYVYADFVYRIPGTGEEYPINPGESIVIAQTALNHKESYTNNNGDVVTVGNPALTVDLSDADFEVYLGTGFSSDIQTDATDMEIIHYRAGNDMILDALGRDGYAIFKADNVVNYPIFRNPKDGENKEPGYMQIPNTVLIDAVDTNRDNFSVPKKLQSAYDASYTYCPLGSYSSQSVIRKTKVKLGERVVLQDTNNSENDFVAITANPKGFAE